jgi:excisionase family DNA binding protein
LDQVTQAQAWQGVTASIYFRHFSTPSVAPGVPLQKRVGGIFMSLGQSVSGGAVGSRIGRSVSLDHAAQLLGVSRRTVYNRIREGRLQTIRTIGGSQRVLLDSVAGVEHLALATVSGSDGSRQ